MRRLVRPLGVLLTLVLLQLVLVESGYACRMPAGDRDTATMADMTMPAGDGHATSAPARSAPHDQSQAPCQFPWAPNGCQAMAPCAPAALTVATANLSHAGPAVDARPTLDPLAPLSVSRAPELPPPRA